MEISVDAIKELREHTGAGVMDCRRALMEAGGDSKKALQLLKEKSVIIVKKQAERSVKQGLVEAYIHAGGRIGAMVEVNCETDFVARTNEFKSLAHELAMQVAALDPQFITKEEIPAGSDIQPEVSCLLLQPYIKDPAMTVQNLIAQTISKTGENIKVGRIARFQVGG